LLLTYSSSSTTVTSLTSPHFVAGTAQFNSSNTVSVALGSAAYSSAYYCTVTNASATGLTYEVNTTSSLSTLTITSSSTSDASTVQYTCMGQ
jgi:hypothetical protein